MANLVQDLENQVVLGQSFPIVARTANANGTSVDCVQASGKVLTAYIDVGAVTGTTPTNDVKVQSSDDNTNWFDVTGATFAQLVTASANVGIRLISFQGQRRYHRLVTTIGGTTPSFTFSGGFIIQPKEWARANSGGFVNDAAPITLA